VQPDDRGAGRHAAIISEGGVDATPGQLRRHERHIARRRLHDDANVVLVGRYVGKRVYTQQRARQGGHLIGGHRPSADAQQQHKWGGKRHQP
jgi:hypothetical protein